MAENIPSAERFFCRDLYKIKISLNNILKKLFQDVIIITEK